MLLLYGSQQGMDLVAKLSIDNGSAVAAQALTYLAVLEVLELFRTNLRPFDHGVKPAAKAVQNLRLLYAIPTSQHASGYCYNSSERQELATFWAANEIGMFEDDPYRKLAFDSCCKVPVCRYMQDGS